MRLWLKEIVKSSLLINEAFHVAVMYSNVFFLYLKGLAPSQGYWGYGAQSVLQTVNRILAAWYQLASSFYKKKKKSWSCGYEWISNTSLSSCNTVKAKWKYELLAWSDHECSAGGIGGWCKVEQSAASPRGLHLPLLPGGDHSMVQRSF